MTARLAWALRWMAGLALFIGVGVGLGVAAWRVCGKYGERCGETGQFFPAYNEKAHRIDLVMHDLNENGIIDTWIYRNEQGIDKVQIDRNEDGAIDRVLLPDAAGTFRLAAMKTSSR